MPQVRVPHLDANLGPAGRGRDDPRLRQRKAEPGAPGYAGYRPALISADLENAQAVFAALQDFGAPLEGLSPKDFSQHGKFFRMGRAPLVVDVLLEIDGIGFEEAWRNRVEAEIDPGTAQKAYFISREDLITNKTASGRPQDVADLVQLRKGDGEQTR